MDKINIKEGVKTVSYETNGQNHFKPTQEVYTELQQAYDHFNTVLFQGQLPSCLITLQRKSTAKGYFSANRFEHTQKEIVIAEIAMNPDHFKAETLPSILSTLVHEMVHLQQAYFGNPGRGRYHNKQWGSMMEAIGLMPSNTGKPGGKRVGERVTHYIIEGDKFDRACQALLAQGFCLSWADRFGYKRERKHNQRKKFICIGCGLNAWAKPNASLACGICELPLRVCG